MKPMIYLASPHSHHNPAIREWRWVKVVEKAGELMVAGNHVFCPIAHTHHIAIATTTRFGSEQNVFDFDYWREYDERMIDLCDLLVVYQLPGWRDSKGVSAEIEYARKTNKPRMYIEYTGPGEPESFPVYGWPKDEI